MNTSKDYYEGRRVLVTGGAGFIGSYLTELLVADGANVTVADDLSRGRIENLESVASEIRFLELDLREPSAARAACGDQDVVLHLASPVAGVEYSRSHHGSMLTDSVLLGFNTLEAARHEGVRRFLYCSSSCVYPEAATVPTPEDEVERGDPELLNEGYGWGKRMGELQARYYAHEYGMEIAIARPFNAYGARQSGEVEKSQVIPALIGRILVEEDPLVVWGSGNQTRSFLHGRDVALALKEVAARHAVADPVNVGTDVETRLRDLVDLLQDITGVRHPVLYDTSKPEGPLRKGADVSKLRQAIGFAPTTPLREGLEEMVEHLRGRLAHQQGS